MERYHYSMLIQWSVEDGAYIVTVPELPGLRTHGVSYAEAARQGLKAIDGWITDARAWGDEVPRPRCSASA
ncbi:MAG TPA: type II toxin-antitoxin system HicB family antitoxin [Chloroflexota bacterium]|jgi:predicted RNase H-like HicB family nuclease